MPPSINLASTAGGTRSLHRTIISVNNEKEGQKKLRSISASMSMQSENSPIISNPSRQRSASSDSIFNPGSVVSRNTEDGSSQNNEDGSRSQNTEYRTRTQVRKLSSLHLDLLTDVFVENLEENQSKLTILDFKRIFQFKGEFSARRVFNIFDHEHKGYVTLQNFIETVERYYTINDDDNAKIEFFIDMYNAGGDLTKQELKSVLSDCVIESGMSLKEPDIENLAETLFQDCVKDGNDFILKECLREELKKHKVLLSKISILMDKWLIPKVVQKKKEFPSLNLGRIVPHRYFTAEYWSLNKSFLIFFFLILATNLVIFTHRALRFNNFPMLSGFAPNPFYMISRGLGRTLLFNTCLVLVLVLRYSITLLRQFGLAKYLPLDHNIYFHKMVGTIIFFQGMIHSLMHLLNFGVNIQPDPVKFIQLSWNYWYDYGHYPLDLYNIPDGCRLVSIDQEESKDCQQGSLEMPERINFDVSRNITVCQACPTGQPYAYYEWILTTRPGMFGMAGCGSLSGVGLFFVLIIMFICSLPFVRRSGHFQVFYCSHMLYFAYFLLLFLHAPDFWAWFLVPAIIWIIEVLYRSVVIYLGHGKTVVSSASILPSKVTCLYIKRPPKFNFNAGDVVYVRIPAVANSEWHPFTISSAPEAKDVFTIHVRGVGGWTNSLHSLVEKELVKQKGVHMNIKNAFQRGKFNRSARTHHRMKNTKSVAFDKDLIQASTVEEIYLSDKLLEINIDGPFGSPSSNIYRAEHAVLISTGIGVTPFASILQSIMHRYWDIKQSCPNCNYTWSNNIEESMFKLKKVDFIWINRNVISFEWFVALMLQLENEQAEQGGQMNRFLDLHMYNTSALSKDDMKGFALQMAMDLLYAKEERDLLTGLKARTIPGRPNWDEVFMNIKLQMKGEVTIFFCGNSSLATTLKYKCEQFGFIFRKEVY